MIPKTWRPARGVSWSRAISGRSGGRGGRLSHVVWELEAVKPQRA